MLKKLIKQFKETSAKPESKYSSLFEDIENAILESDAYIATYSKFAFSKLNSYQALKKLPVDERTEALRELAKRVNNYFAQRHSAEYTVTESKKSIIASALLDAIMRTKLDLKADFSFYDFLNLLYKYGTSDDQIRIIDRPIGALATQIENHAKKHGFPKNIQDDIEQLLKHPLIQPYLDNATPTSDYWGPDVAKAVAKIQRVAGSVDGDGNIKVPPYQLGSGRFGKIVDKDIKAMPPEKQDHWHALFHELSKASAGKPTKKFTQTINPLIDTLGTKDFKQQTNEWLSTVAKFDIQTTVQTFEHYGRVNTYESYEFVETHSHNLIKGLLWAMTRFHDAESLQIIAQLVEKCFQKIPEQGPAAAGVGNAGIYMLAQSKGLDGLSHLSRLKLRIRQNNTQKLIQKYIDEQAKKLGVKATQVEELSVLEYNLKDGKRVEPFEDFELKLQVQEVGTTTLEWFKADGTPQKSVPSVVKTSTSLSAKLKKMRDLVKQINKSMSAQRDRIDRLYTEDVSWSIEDFNKYYLHHGLVSQISQKLIWQLNEQPGIYYEGQWQDIHGDVVNVDTNTIVRLWHPIDSDTDSILAWRERLEALGIKQPLKQAYRELYILTDAEINTRVYSNRMAAHILKQHQFNALTALRGWRYSLLGAYDDGRNGAIASKHLPEYDMTAQYWINEIIDDTDSFNDAGIWHYVATDQVRFCNSNDEAINLIDISPLVFSEIMRDVDLFVGVASVGNDPQWQDGGPDSRPDYRTYWQSYSFGDLTEIAKTRKTVLERLLPRLKIRDVTHIDGKFLIVNGKKNTYKIHIGSGNILIAPDDRYLCIVPSRGKDKNTEEIFLPFEGDKGLSIVLSKAFLLASDDKIKDPTIVSQL